MGGTFPVCRHVPIAQLDRASASEAEGCRFDSCWGRFAAPLFSNTRTRFSFLSFFPVKERAWDWAF